MTVDPKEVRKFIDERVDSLISSLGPGLIEDSGLPARSAPLDIAIPIYNGEKPLTACLESLLPTLSTGDTVWLLDDGSENPRVIKVMREFAASWPDTNLLQQANNLGFVAVANELFRLTERDLVLLNSDTLVQPGWLEHLQRTLDSNPRAGIVCPISNNATLLSVLPDDSPLTAECAASASLGRIRLPTAVGFCMLISRKLLEASGAFDPIFAPGYGEENDFSMRALQLGFDIEAADRAVVVHRGHGSFGLSRARRLQLEHKKVLDGRWPEYAALVQSWWRDNPLREKAEYLARASDGRDAIVHVLHRQYHVGGTERVTRDLIRALSGKYAHTLVYPGQTENRWCDIERRPSDLCRELMLNNRWLQPRVRLAGHGADLSCPQSEQSLAKIVRGGDAAIVHFHHLLHWDSLLLPSLVKRLGARVMVSVHDFFFNCPVHNQLEYSRGQPCGRRFAHSDSRCAACLTSYAAGGVMAGSPTSYAQARHALIGQTLCEADAIVVPSHFMRSKLIGAFGHAVDERLRIVPHGTEIPAALPVRRICETIRIGYFGGDQVLKGATLVVQLARAMVDEAVQFRIYGRVKGFSRSDLPGNVELCGFYNPDQVGHAMAEIDLTLVPSHYEESFSLIVSESWAHGVPVLTSERGALRERVINGVNGWTVPDLSLKSWLDALTRLIRSEAIGEVQGRLRTQFHRSTQAASDEYDALYRELLKDGRPKSEPRVPLSPSAADFELRLRRFRPRWIRQDAHWYLKMKRHSGRRPRCLGIIRDLWGTAQYRIRYPLIDLAAADFTDKPVFHVVKQSGFSILDACGERELSHIFVQPFLSDQGLSMMEQLSRLAGKRVVLVIDDLWTQLPLGNPARKLMPPDIQDRLAYAASLSNRVVLTTVALKRCLGLRHPGLTVIENALPSSLWVQAAGTSETSTGNRMRVGWAGAPQHGSDIDFLEPVIEATADVADWVFLGMCPENLRPLVKNAASMLPFSEYPGALANAGLDLALAPLEDNAFNRCKSRLKVLEYGILGIPVVASALDPYLASPVTLIEGNDPERWAREIRNSLRDRQELRSRGENLREWVSENHMLEHRRAQWQGVLD